VDYLAENLLFLVRSFYEAMGSWQRQPWSEIKEQSDLLNGLTQKSKFEIL